MKAIQDDVIASRPKRAVEFGNMDALRSIYPMEQREDYMKQYGKIKPKTRAVLYASKPIIQYSDETQFVHLPLEQTSARADVYVYDNKVALSTLNSKQISVLVESQEISQLFYDLFDYIWSLQKQLK